MTYVKIHQVIYAVQENMEMGIYTLEKSSRSQIKVREDELDIKYAY